ncbi:MAG: hypothetical protein Q6L60_03870 [Thermostichus sp. HHBFW_bins_43]
MKRLEPEPNPGNESALVQVRVEILSPPHLKGYQGYVLGKECCSEVGKGRHAWTGRWLVQIDDQRDPWLVSLEATEFRPLDGSSSISA